MKPEEQKIATPRTEAEGERQAAWAEQNDKDTYDCWMETFKFARTLERENAVLRELLWTQLQWSDGQINAAIEQRLKELQ